MIVHIKAFFDALIGATLPDVCYLVLAFSGVFLILRAFLSLFGYKAKIVDFSYYAIVAYLIISSLGGFQWNFSFL